MINTKQHNNTTKEAIPYSAEPSSPKKEHNPKNNKNKATLYSYINKLNIKILKTYSAI